MKLKTAYVLVLATVLLAAALLPSTASAWTTASGSVEIIYNGNLSPGPLEDEEFYNYDFKYENQPYGNKVDYTVNMLFLNNGTLENVYETYWGRSSHSVMWMEVCEYGDRGWEANRGTRQGGNLAEQANHMRLYAYNSDYFISPAGGKFSIGTTHFDYEWQQTGWSETVEGGCCQWASEQGLQVAPDLYFLYNEEPYRKQSTWIEDHYWLNDGYASVVWIP